MTEDRKNVLILCTGNSARSQMAEVLWNHLGNGEWRACSAGSNPAGHVHPMALAALADVGLNTVGLSSKHVDHFAMPNSTSWSRCATTPRRVALCCLARRVVHWPFDDPAAAEGSEAQKRQKFAEIRGQIAARIEAFLTAERAVVRGR